MSVLHVLHLQGGTKAGGGECRLQQAQVFA